VPPPVRAPTRSFNFLDNNTLADANGGPAPELEAIAVESKRTIEIDEFVPKKEIDELYLNSPYYLVPDGEVGEQAFAGHS
jgi:hypothetical protein